MTSCATCTVLVGPCRGVEIRDGIVDRRTRRARNRDTAAVTLSCSMGGYGDARACQRTVIAGRVVGA